MQSHYYLADIFVELWEHVTPRGSFIDMVFRLVLFHQSLTGASDFPPMVELTKEERLIYCDQDFFRLIKALMVCDSSSYMFVMDEGDRMDRCVGEFTHSSDLMIGDWDQKFKLLRHHLSLH